MSETPTLAPGIAEQLAALPEASRAQAQSALRSAGFNVEAPAALKAAVEQVDMTTGKTSFIQDGLTPTQEIEMLRGLYQHAPQAALRYAEANGIKPETFGATAQQLLQPNAEPTIQGFEPPSAPSGYLFDKWAKDDVDTATIAEIEQEAREAFYSAGMPAFQARELFDAIAENAARYADMMSDDEKMLAARSEGSLFNKAHGASTASPENQALFDAALSALPPAFMAEVNSIYGLHSARAVTAMNNFGRLVLARRARMK